MDSQDFMKQLIEISDLMAEEKYEDALILLERLKEVERNGDFDYGLTHKLYQLDSNCRSLFNQKIILKQINTIAAQQNSTSFKNLREIIKNELNVDEDTLRKEIELLILTGLLDCKIDGNELKF